VRKYKHVSFLNKIDEDFTWIFVEIIGSDASLRTDDLLHAMQAL
jgi:hypothetical protein